MSRLAHNDAVIIAIERKIEDGKLLFDEEYELLRKAGCANGLPAVKPPNAHAAAASRPISAVCGPVSPSRVYAEGDVRQASGPDLDRLAAAKAQERAMQTRAQGLRQQLRRVQVERAVATQTAGRQAASAAYKADVDAEKNAMDGVEAASQEVVLKMSIRFNKAMVPIFADPVQRSWFRLYKFMDQDGSGMITYFEMTDLVRNKLMLSERTLPDVQA